ncbi:MAG: gas vesicle protein K [Xanthobacteraceae bacterium]
MQGEAARVRGQKVIHAPDDQAMLNRFGTRNDDRRDAPQRIVADPQRVERDLARLVLSVIELLRQLLERQAVRRVESGTLSEEEIERLGETLLKLETRMGELKAAFGLGDQELTLDLGPLRNLVSQCE